MQTTKSPLSAAALAKNVTRAREGDDVGDGQEVCS
jgi:hypothetical protein